MAYCDTKNVDENGSDTACDSGYNVAYNSCCNHQMYVFWRVLSFAGMCGLCVLCILMVTMRSRSMSRRQQRTDMYGENLMQQPQQQQGYRPQPPSQTVQTYQFSGSAQSIGGGSAPPAQ